MRPTSPQNTRAFLERSDLGLPPLTTEAVSSGLASFNVSDVVRELGALNTFIQREGADTPGFCESVAAEYFKPEILDRFQELAASGKKMVLTPAHLRATITLALRYADRLHGKSLAGKESRLELGDLMVSLPEFLAGKLPRMDPRDPSALVAVDLNMVVRGYRRSPKVDDEVLMKAIMMERDIDALDTWLRAKLGFGVAEYEALFLLIWMNFRREANLPLASPGQPIELENLKAVVGAPEALMSYLVGMCHDLSESGTPPEGDPSVAWIADNPFALKRGVMSCLDYDFMTQKLSRGLWNIGRRREGDPGRFDDRAGNLFGDHCTRLLSIAAEARDSAWAAPREVLGTDRADGLFVDHSYAAIFEFKSNVIDPRIRFGKDTTALCDYILSKYVTDRGFAQCANHLEVMLRDESTFRLDGVRKIVPCLVVCEEALTWDELYTFATKSAEPLFAKFGRRVATPLILHFSDLAYLVARSRDHSLPAMLLKLASTEMFRYTSTTNAIMEFWPHEESVINGNPVNFTLPTDPFTRARDHISRVAANAYRP